MHFAIIQAYATIYSPDRYRFRAEPATLPYNGDVFLVLVAWLSMLAVYPHWQTPIQSAVWAQSFYVVHTAQDARNIPWIISANLQCSPKITNLNSPPAEIAAGIYSGKRTVSHA